MSSILQVSRVTRRFAGLIAVNDVSFALNEGEILGVIGPNGAGKTTLVSLISGTLTPTSGDIIFENRSIVRLPAYRRGRLGIGRTFQIMRPFPGLSVLDNVAVGALFGHDVGKADLAEAREKALDHLTFVGLGHFAGQRADELSGPGRRNSSSPRPLLCSQKYCFATRSWPG